MKAKILALVLIFVTNFRKCQGRTYENYSLYNVIPTEYYQLKFLQNLNQQKYMDVLFWKKPYKVYHNVQFIVDAKDHELFIERARHFRIDVQLLVKNIQSAFDNQLIGKYLRLEVDSYNWNSFHTLEDIYQWLSDIALKYPGIVQLEEIGKTIESRQIYAIGIRRPGARGRVIVEGGIHGNEWIGTEFVTYLVNQLIHVNETKNSLLKHVATTYSWYLVPVLNPDGYVYSQNQDRLWKKNRRKLGRNYGVNLNRNFDNSFGKYDSSTNPSDENFCGPAPYSEPETRAFSQYVTRKADNLKYFFSFHTYGEKILIPFADSVIHGDNYREMENYGKQAILKMYKLNGVRYSIGTTYDTLGLRMSGTSASWMKKRFKVKYVFTMLLRDNGTYGYALPHSQILPTCEETLSGLLEIMTARPSRVHAKNFFTSSRSEIPVSSAFITMIFLLVI